MSRTGKRKDALQPAVEAIARGYGWDTVDTSGAGDGFPDVVAYKRSLGFLLVEVKSGAGKLTQAQKGFQVRHRMPVVVVRSEAEAEQVFGGRG